MAFDLASRKKSILVDTPIPTFESIAVVDARRVLLDTHKRSLSTIKILDLVDLSIRDVRPGYRPMFLPLHEQLFFFQSSMETGPRLFHVQGLDIAHEPVEQVVPGNVEFSSYSYVVPISDDEVVFNIVGDNGETPPYRFNVVTKELTALPLTHPCTAFAWRMDSSKLLCGNSAGREFYFVALDGSSFEKVSLPNGVPLIYIAQDDLLVMNVSRLQRSDGVAREMHDIWAVSMKNGRSELLVENEAPGRGGMAWVPGSTKTPLKRK